MICCRVHAQQVRMNANSTSSATKQGFLPEWILKQYQESRLLCILSTALPLSNTAASAHFFLFVCVLLRNAAIKQCRKFNRFTRWRFAYFMLLVMNRKRVHCPNVKSLIDCLCGYWLHHCGCAADIVPLGDYGRNS